jgi:DNA-binding GntR family transcriptional regulator
MLTPYTAHSASMKRSAWCFSEKACASARIRERGTIAFCFSLLEMRKIRDAVKNRDAAGARAAAEAHVVAAQRAAQSPDGPAAPGGAKVRSRARSSTRAA